MSFYNTFIRPILPEKNIPHFTINSYSHHLFGSTYICAQMFSRMKQKKRKISSKNSGEHYENSLGIAATCIESV